MAYHVRSGRRDVATIGCCPAAGGSGVRTRRSGRVERLIGTRLVRARRRPGTDRRPGHRRGGRRAPGRSATAKPVPDRARRGTLGRACHPGRGAAAVCVVDGRAVQGAVPGRPGPGARVGLDRSHLVLDSRGRAAVLRAALRYSRSLAQVPDPEAWDVSALVGGGALLALFLAPRSSATADRRRWRDEVRMWDLRAAAEGLMLSPPRGPGRTRRLSRPSWSRMMDIGRDRGPADVGSDKSKIRHAARRTSCTVLFALELQSTSPRHVEPPRAMRHSLEHRVTRLPSVPRQSRGRRPRLLPAGSSRGFCPPHHPGCYLATSWMTS